MDFKGRTQMSCGNWCYPLTIIDDHSRFAVSIEACANEQLETRQTKLEVIFRRYGMPLAIYCDNGNPCGGGVPDQWTHLRVWLLKLGIELIHSRPYHPRGRGKNERFQRSLKAEVTTSLHSAFRHMLRELSTADVRFTITIARLKRLAWLCKRAKHD